MGHSTEGLELSARRARPKSLTPLCRVAAAWGPRHSTITSPLHQ